MAESLPPESDHKDSSASDEGLVQIGVHGAVFPPPEQESAAAGIAAGASSIDPEPEAKLSEHDDMSTNQVEETPEPPPASKTAHTQTTGSEESAKRESCLTGCLHDVLLVLISALLGGALVLGALLFLNGTLDMKGHDSVVSLNSRAETLSDDLSALNERVNSNTETTEALGENLSDTSEQLDSVNEQVQTGWSLFQDLDDQVQTLDAQVQEVDAQVQEVDAHVQTLDGQVQDLDRRTQMLDIKITTVHEEVVVLNHEVAKLSLRSDRTEAEMAGISQQMAGINQSAERFDTFADGLRALADSLTRPSAVVPETDLSATEPISATEPVTVSITITTSETVTATGPMTPTVSLPLVGNQVDADATDTDAEVPISASIDGIPNLALFPPLVPIPDLSPGQSHIFGLVWDDLNGNGQPEEGEIPIPAVTIILRDARGNVLVTTVTDSAGRYLFANIAPGVYIVEETDPTDVVSISSNLVTVTAPVGGVIETNFADQF